MARPKAKKVRDGILHVRCHQQMLERLKTVSEKNHRTASGEAIHAIEEYLHAEEVRLGLSASAPIPVTKQNLVKNRGDASTCG